MGRQPWHAHTGVELLADRETVALWPGESLPASRILTEVERELGDIVACHMLRDDPTWVLGWFAAEARAAGRKDLGVPFGFRQPKTRSTRRAA